MKKYIISIVLLILVSNVAFCKRPKKNADKNIEKVEVVSDTVFQSEVVPDTVAMSVDSAVQSSVMDSIAVTESKQTECDSLVSKSVNDEPNETFVMVESMPEFPGGAYEFNQWLSNTMEYSDEMRQKGVYGKVVVRFIVDTDGCIKKVKVVKGVDPLLDAEAVRLVKMMPKWTPGRQGNKVVKVQYTMPINFNIM